MTGKYQDDQVSQNYNADDINKIAAMSADADRSKVLGDPTVTVHAHPAGLAESVQTNEAFNFPTYLPE